MDDKFNVRYVQSSCSDVSCDKKFLLAALKVIYVLFSHLLRNVPMENGDLFAIEISD